MNNWTSLEFGCSPPTLSQCTPTSTQIMQCKQYQSTSDRTTLYCPKAPLLKPLSMASILSCGTTTSAFWQHILEAINRYCNGNTTSPNVRYSVLCYPRDELPLPTSRFTSSFVFYKRFIDDIIGLWRENEDPVKDDNEWQEFQHSLAYGNLTWKVSCRTSTVNFMDQLTSSHTRNPLLRGSTSSHSTCTCTSHLIQRPHQAFYGALSWE